MKKVVLSLVFLTGAAFVLTTIGLDNSELMAATNSPASCISECGTTADGDFEQNFHEKGMSWEKAHKIKCEFLAGCYSGCL